MAGIKDGDMIFYIWIGQLLWINQLFQCLLEAGAVVDKDTMDVAERLGRHSIRELLSAYPAQKSCVAK